MVVTESPKSIEVKLEHERKVYWSMVVTCVPDKSIECKLVQYSKRRSPMLVSELGKSIEVKSVLAKALLLMVVSELGIMIEVKLVQ